MGKITKNPSQLTDEDLYIIDRVSFGCVAFFYNALQQYRTPKEFVEKFLLKNFKSDKSFAAGKIVVNSLYNKYDNLLYSSKINEDLKKDHNIAPLRAAANRNQQGGK